MAHSLSAKKRIRQNINRRIRNRARTKQVRLQVRKVIEAVGERNVEKARTELQAAIKKIDQVAAKGTLHRNAAARKKSRLQRRVNALVSK